MGFDYKYLHCLPRRDTVYSGNKLCDVTYEATVILIVSFMFSLMILALIPGRGKRLFSSPNLSTDAFVPV